MDNLSYRVSFLQCRVVKWLNGLIAMNRIRSCHHSKMNSNCGQMQEF